MKQDEIIEMARQAGLITFSQAWGCFWVEGLGVKNGKLEAFAKLVAAKEREECAKEADKWSRRDDDVGSFIGKAIRARGEQ